MNLRVPRSRGASTGTKVATRVRWDSARPEVWLDLDQAACAMLQTRLGTPSDVHLESAYYDTADLILHRAGIRLEVVRAGRHSVQRVTLPPALHRRDRLIHEAEAAGPLPDRGHLLAVLPPTVVAALGERPLGRLFALRFTRSTAMVP